MAKDKKSSKVAAPAPAAAKPVKSVKAGRVTKPVEQTKAAAKDVAKKAAKGVEKASKKVKAAVESDTSDSSDSSDSEVEQKVNGKKNVADSDSGDDDSASESGSSDGSDSEEEVAPKKVAAPKTNGKKHAASDSEDSDSNSDSEEEAVPKTNGKAAVADDSDDASSSGSDSDSGDEADAKAGANKKVKGGDDASDSSSDGSSDSDGDSDEEEEAVKPKAEETGKKRKAEEAIAQTPKKSKIDVNGELKDATANLFVGNLSWNVDEEWLTREFEEFGGLVNVRIITNRDNGRSKGFGYVEFESSDKAAEALQAKQEALLDGRNLRIDFSTPRTNSGFNDNQTPQQRSSDRAQKYGDTPREPSMTLFVGNISFDADENMLREMFEEYGTITGCRMPTDRESGQYKGYGYVDYTSMDEAKAAFDALQGAELAGRPVRLDFSTPRSNDSPRRGGSFGGRGGGDRGGFGGRGGRGGGRGGFGDRGGRGGGRGAPRGGRGNTTNRGGFGDFSGRKVTF